MEDITAAHPTLPIPSLVQVTNLENGRELVVRLNDRGPFVDNRIIDLSRKSAELLGVKDQGTAKVRVKYIGPAPAAPKTHMVTHTPQPRLIAPAVAQRAVISQTEISRPRTAEYGYARKDHFVQLGSFADISNAEHLYRRLARDYDVDIVSARVNGADFFRVMVGPVSSETAAQTLRDRIASEGHARGLIVAAR